MKRWNSMAMTVLVVSSCSVSSDYARPEIDVPAAFAHEAAGPLVTGDRSDADLASWWQCFEDERLCAIVDGVLEDSLDLEAALARVESARQAYGVAASFKLPTVDATGSYQRTRPFFGVVAPTQDQWTAGGTLAWELDLFGRVRRSVQAAVASFEAQVEDARAVRIALAAEAAATYLQVLSLHERLAIARKNVASQEQSLEFADLRFDKGVAAGLDPAQARVNLFSTQAAVPALELQLRRNQHRLAVLMGRDPRELLGELSVDHGLPSFPSSLAVGVPADLMRNRPDLRGLERQLAAQSARVGVAVASRYPAVQLQGSWDWLAANPGDLFDGSGFGGIGPFLALPIFNAGRLKAQVGAEEALLQDLDLQLRQRVLVAQEEVENALVAIVRDRRAVELLQKAAQAAGESVEFARQLYTSGQSDFQNVLDAQRSLFALEDDVALAELATLLDVVELYRALGGGWGQAPAESESADSRSATP